MPDDKTTFFALEDPWETAFDRSSKETAIPAATMAAGVQSLTERAREAATQKLDRLLATSEQLQQAGHQPEPELVNAIQALKVALNMELPRRKAVALEVAGDERSAANVARDMSTDPGSMPFLALMPKHVQAMALNLVHQMQATLAKLHASVVPSNGVAVVKGGDIQELVRIVDVFAEVLQKKVVQDGSRDLGANAPPPAPPTSPWTPLTFNGNRYPHDLPLEGMHVLIEERPGWVRMAYLQRYPVLCFHEVATERSIPVAEVVAWMKVPASYTGPKESMSPPSMLPPGTLPPAKVHVMSGTVKFADFPPPLMAIDAALKATWDKAKLRPEDMQAVLDDKLTQLSLSKALGLGPAKPVQD